jgi:hypothetical protein
MNALFKRDAERLIAAGRQYYSTAFPNPERVGCPDGATLRALVGRKLDRAAAKQIDSHMTHCSPCFVEYVRLRESWETSARQRKLAAIAAVIVLAVVSWALVRLLRGRNQERQQSSAANPNVSYRANLLDLRNKAALRGAGQNGNESPAVLPREPLDLLIYLPTGSEPGKYEVQVTQGPAQPLLKAQGNASLRDHIAVLEVKLELQQLQPGPYLFWIRQPGTSWSYYPVLVKSGS